MAKTKNRLSRIAGDYDSNYDPYADPLTQILDGVAPTTTSTGWTDTSTPGTYLQTQSDGSWIIYDEYTGVYEDSTGAMWTDGTKSTTTTTKTTDTATSIAKTGQGILSFLSTLFGGGTTAKTTTAGTSLSTAGTSTTNIPLILGVGVLAAIFIVKQLD